MSQSHNLRPVPFFGSSEFHKNGLSGTVKVSLAKDVGKDVGTQLKDIRIDRGHFGCAPAQETLHAGFSLFIYTTDGWWNHDGGNCKKEAHL
jgi:hypothetical protein